MEPEDDIPSRLVDESLDGDVILAAQASLLERIEGEVVVATGNLKHLTLVCRAKHWNDGTWV